MTRKVQVAFNSAVTIARRSHHRPHRGIARIFMRHNLAAVVALASLGACTQKTDAEYKNGVLTIRLDKDETAQSKRVPVKGA